MAPKCSEAPAAFSGLVKLCVDEQYVHSRSVPAKDQTQSELPSQKVHAHFGSQMVEMYIRACVESSTAVVSVVHNVVAAGDPKRDLLGAWWFSLYHGKALIPYGLPSVV